MLKNDQSTGLICKNLSKLKNKVPLEMNRYKGIN